MIGIVEVVGSRLVDGDGAGVSSGIGLFLAGVDLQRFELVRHGFSCWILRELCFDAGYTGPALREQDTISFPCKRA